MQPCDMHCSITQQVSSALCSSCYLNSYKCYFGMLSLLGTIHVYGNFLFTCGRLDSDRYVYTHVGRHTCMCILNVSVILPSS